MVVISVFVLACILMTAFLSSPSLSFLAGDGFGNGLKKCRFANRLLETVVLAIRGGLWLLDSPEGTAFAKIHFDVSNIFPPQCFLCFFF